MVKIFTIITCLISASLSLPEKTNGFTLSDEEINSVVFKDDEIKINKPKDDINRDIYIIMVPSGTSFTVIENDSNTGGAMGVYKGIIVPIKIISREKVK